MLFGYFLAAPFAIVGTAAFVFSSIVLVRLYRRDPVRFPVVLYASRFHPPCLLVLSGLVGLLVAPFVALSRGVLYGEAVGALSAVLYSVGAALTHLRGLRLTRRLWLPREVIPS